MTGKKSNPEARNLTPHESASLLRKFGIRADKSLGQNFLDDELMLQKIVKVAEVSAADTVLEIGPGLGSLTRHLAVAAKEVVAVELDTHLIPILTDVLTPHKNVRVIQGNFLDFRIQDLIQVESFMVIANIPYYITSAIIRHLMENLPRPKRVVLTIQKEVAQRICAEPGDMSLLALSVQVFGEPAIAFEIPSNAFFPEPNVDSAVIKLDAYPEPVIPSERLDFFFRLAKAGFSQRRKTLRNSLSGGLSISPSDAENLLQSSGIDPKRRAETLSLSEWTLLTTMYSSPPIN
jgi:16S rRNA (adenine1518-N6/adenine1519-N6)-dimethyltransferase